MEKHVNYIDINGEMIANSRLLYTPPLGVTVAKVMSKSMVMKLIVSREISFIERPLRIVTNQGSILDLLFLTSFGAFSSDAMNPARDDVVTHVQPNTRAIFTNRSIAFTISRGNY